MAPTPTEFASAFAALDDDALIVLDPVAWRCEFANDAAAGLTGLRAGEPLARDAGPWRELAGSPAETRSLQRLRHARTGELLWIEARALRVTLAGRPLVAIRVRDVSAREGALRELELLRTVLDLSDDVLAIVERDTMRTLWVNRVASEWVGMTREDYIRLDPWVPVVGATREMYERDYDELIAMSPTPKIVIRERFRADGSRFMAEHVRSALNVDGRWIIAISVRDISSRLQAETAAARFRAAVDASGDGMLVVDPSSGTVLDANDVAGVVLGLSRDKLTGARIDEVAPQFGPQDFEAAMASSQVQVTLARVHRQQQDVYIERRRRAFRSDGKWLVYDGYRDVTERERAAGELERRMEELARSNRDLEQFAYMTSHDLSEPLRMIGSYTELLARRYRDRLDDDGREFMGFIVDGVRRMKRLIDDLLAYSRAGRAEAAMQPIPLDEALDEALLNLSRAIDDAGATIERQPLPCVASQRVAMIQLFQNLVGNAIKFRSGRKLVIRVGAEERGASWRFTVADNGIGIAPKDFERIFVVFQRLHSRSDYDGTGIGLAIAKKIVERHGGRIWVESQPGEGTTFVFTLPRSANADG